MKEKMGYILLADDSEVILDIVKNSLILHNYKNILEAHDGQEALEISKKNQGNISLYVLDVNMPRMDGISLVKEIRAFDANTPIVMLTTEVEKAKIEKAKEYGATGWIIKPFNSDKFIQIVKMLLENE
ncbi:MAG: response regulator [Leptonema sp. (in: bacteria)]